MRLLETPHQPTAASDGVSSVLLLKHLPGVTVKPLRSDAKTILLPPFPCLPALNRQKNGGRRITDRVLGIVSVMTFIALLGLSSLFFATTAQAGPRTSTNYSISTDITESTGSRAASANYTDDGSLGDVTGVSSAAVPALTLNSGFIGQLYEARSLAVSALPAAVVESGTTQLSAVATMDDDSIVRLGGSDAKWAVQAGPLAGITLSGLATAGEVFINAPATVRARWNGISGDLTLTVLNANVTQPGIEADVPGFLFQVIEPRMAGL